MKNTIVSGIAALALSVSAFAGFGNSAASAYGSAEVFTPPNCEYVEVAEGYELQCELPPQCELVTTGEGGLFQAVSIECDIDEACELLSGEFFGVTYWYIECDEPECISGCGPTTPTDLGLKTTTERTGVLVR